MATAFRVSGLTPFSWNSRVTRIAYICAGDIIPYGATSAYSPLIVPPPRPAPKRPNCPWASPRNATTQSAYPAAIAAAALPTDAAAPPPPEPHCMFENRSSVAPNAEWIRDGAPASLRADATAWETYQRQEIRMPAFGSTISEAKIAQLTAYVLAANAWFGPTEEVALRGEEIIRRQCLACHNVGGAGGLRNPGALVPIVPGLWGPDFEDLVRSDEELREWILDGQSRRVASSWPVRWFWRRQLISMPSFRDRLSAEEIEAVTAYIRWLGRTEGGTVEEGPS